MIYFKDWFIKTSYSVDPFEDRVILEIMAANGKTGKYVHIADPISKETLVAALRALADEIEKDG